MTVREDKYVIGGILGTNSADNVQIPGNLWALNLKADSNGVITPTLLWNITFTPPPFPQIVNTSQTTGARTAIIDPEDGVFIFTDTTTRRIWGYNLADGSLKWGPTDPGPQFDYYGMGNLVYQGKFFTYGYGGILNAYDINTGKLLWNYTAYGIGQESPYADRYPLSLACIADGKLYMYSTEHSPSTPLWRGSDLRCINASNGAEIWKISHWGTAVISDGFLVGLDYYDNQLYCYGKGPSATTIEAPLNAVTLGSSLVIQGTVTDQSSGAKGTPAISDASMSQWMEYLYKQQPKPTNATGVPVILFAIDPNGNTQNIGTVTSDTLGNYAISWKPPVPGLYTVVANFAGSNSYYSSVAETHFVVAAAAAVAAPASPQASATPPPTTAPTQTATPSPEVTATPVPAPSSPGIPTTYIVIAVVAIIVVVAAAALALRRRK